MLLVRYTDGRAGRPLFYWVPPGGALEQDETHRAAAIRELREETGLDADIGQELWQRAFDADFGNGEVRQVERYFLVRIEAVAPFVANSSPEAIQELRWWSRAELVATDDVIFPEGFSAALDRILHS